MRVATTGVGVPRQAMTTRASPIPSEVSVAGCRRMASAKRARGGLELVLVVRGEAGACYAVAKLGQHVYGTSLGSGSRRTRPHTSDRINRTTCSICSGTPCWRHRRAGGLRRRRTPAGFSTSPTSGSSRQSEASSHIMKVLKSAAGPWRSVSSGAPPCRRVHAQQVVHIGLGSPKNFSAPCCSSSMTLRRMTPRTPW